MARPRSDEARRKAMAAATELIIEGGVGNLTMEQVAARSGVAKTTIYRHWPERSALVLDAVRSHFAAIGTPDTGSLRGDLLAFFGLIDRRDLSGKVGDIMPSVIEAAGRDPDMAAIIDRLGAEREQGVMQIVERARARGEIATDLDSEQLVGVIVGPIVFQKVVRRRKATPGYIRACIDVALSGISALGADTVGADPPAPGRATGSAAALPVDR